MATCDGCWNAMAETPLAHTAGEIMNPHPVTIAPDAFAGEALALNGGAQNYFAYRCRTPAGEVLGVLHLHDLWTTARP